MNYPSAIEQAEREIQRDKDDLRRLKKRYPGYDFIRVDTIKPDSTVHVARGSQPEMSEVEKEVLKIVNGAPDREWTSRSALEALRGSEFRLPEKEDAAMNAVGYALIALRESGRILRSHEGRGRDPHRYVAIPSDAEKEVGPEETTS